MLIIQTNAYFEVQKNWFVKLKVTYTLENTIYVLFTIYAAKKEKSRHIHMCNLNICEGQFQQFYNKCDFMLKDIGKCHPDCQQGKSHCY